MRSLTSNFFLLATDITSDDDLFPSIAYSPAAIAFFAAEDDDVLPPYPPPTFIPIGVPCALMPGGI